jgi:hypothetical protein
VKNFFGTPAGTVLVPDATSDYQGSAEAGTPVRIRSKPYAPLGRSGDAVFRRLHVTVDVPPGGRVSLRITPVIDGVPLAFSRVTVSRITAGRHTWKIPLAKEPTRDPGRYHMGTTGAQGSAIQVEVESWGDSGSAGPRGAWTLERVNVDYLRGSSSARERR